MVFWWTKSVSIYIYLLNANPPFKPLTQTVSYIQKFKRANKSRVEWRTLHPCQATLYVIKLISASHLSPAHIRSHFTLTEINGTFCLW